jgi:large subunit ribosomal protein L6
MARIGKFPIPIPDKVKVAINSDTVKIEGPKGTLEQKIPQLFSILTDDNQIKVVPKEGSETNDALRGTIRALLNNIVVGVTEGFQRSLFIDGQGYRAIMEGKNMKLQIGYPDPIMFNPPEGITLEVPSPQHMVVNGIDKELVGNVCAKIREIRPPEPYKGKGIRYEEEVIRRKAGKKAGYGTTGT